MSTAKTITERVRAYRERAFEQRLVRLEIYAPIDLHARIKHSDRGTYISFKISEPQAATQGGGGYGNKPNPRSPGGDIPFLVA
jgi:hypothetical protein